MPFRNGLRAQTSAFDHGCGLHCLAHSYVLNLKHGRFQPAEEERTLQVLLDGFKAQYRDARTLTTADLKQILVNDLQNPLHREVVLSRVLRRMLPPGDCSRPGADVADDLVLNLSARLGMRMESYTPLPVAVRQHLRTQGILAPTKADFERAEREIRASDVYLIDADNNVLLRRALADHPIPADAPVLKLMNEHGGHWEWEYNLHGDDVLNLRGVEAHNAAYPRHKVRYGNNDSRNASVYGDELNARFNQALLNRAHIYASGQALSSELEAYENEILAREKRIPRAVPSAAVPPTAVPPASTNTPGNGLMGLFGSLFNAFMPALTAAANRPPMNSAIPVVGNVLNIFSDFFGAPKDQQNSVVDDGKENHQGFNGTDIRYKGAISSLASTILGWAGKLFNFVGNMIGIAEQAQKTDPSRPLEDAEIKTQEDALLQEYIRFLPDKAVAFKKKLYADWRNAGIPREKLLNDLKGALLEYDCVAEHDALLFKQHLAKLDPAVKRQLQIQYHRLHGGSLVWKNLAEHLARRGLLKEASEILNREEYQILNEGFSAADDHPNPASLEAAREYYGQALNQFAYEVPSRSQYQTRLQMLEAIKRGGENGELILGDLRRIFRTAYSADPSVARAHSVASADSGFGFVHDSGRREGAKDRPVDSALRMNVSSKPEGWSEKDWDAVFENLNHSFKAGQQDGASISLKTSDGRMDNCRMDGFRPGFAAHAARHSTFPVSSPRPATPLFQPSAFADAEDASGRGRGSYRMGRSAAVWENEGLEIADMAVD